MKLRKTCAVMVMLAVLGPLASAPAMASGGGGGSWYSWLLSLFGGGNHGGNQGGGSATNLPGPGALGLVMVGLAATIVVSRRRK